MSLTKPFSEVFPTLQLSGEEGELFRTSEVRRVSATKDRSRVEVYLVSTNIITDRQIKSMEKKLSSLFIGRRTKVILHTRFNLSEQYNTKTLLEMYKDSMAGELKSISPLTYNVYRKADIYPSDEKTLVVNLTDNIVSHKEAENIRSFLDHVFNVRCSVTTHIKIKYEKAEPTPERREAEKNILDFLNSVTHKDPEKTAEEKALEEEKRKEEDRRRKGFRNAKNPDVIYGRDFKDDCRSIDTIIGDLEESVTVKGRLIGIDEHAISNETKYIIKLDMTDFTDSISIKVFINAEDHDEFRSLIGADGLEKGKPGIFVKVKGVYMTDKFDRENTIQKIYGIKTIPAFGEVREDNAPVKRVELHCHTKMSEMDAVSDVGSILKQASSWGMKALAVTDHGNVQVFPVANHSLPADPEFKMIYGVEGYLVDDTQKVVTQIGLNETNEKHSLKGAYVVFDIETTGLSPEKNRIIEIGAVRVENGEVVDRYNEFVNPEVPIPFRIQNLTGINDKMVMGAPTIKDILPGFLEFSKDAVMVAHNASFDCSFIRKNAKDLGLDFSKTVVDTVALSRLLLPGIKNYKLDTVAHELSVSLENHHRAVDDATCTGEIFIKLCNKLMEQDIYTLEGIEKIDVTTSSVIKKMRMHHVVILAKNETGRINLYKLVSLSHINYFSKRPRIPKSMLTRYREGLIIGSACASGELFNEILRGASEEELVRTASFYDYLEIQPLGNNRFLMNDDENDYTEEDLKAFNVKILKLGEALGKPVCATGDVHFLNPSDAIYRRIIMNGKGYDDADEQPPLYLHTTDEMLREFSYLGEEKAYEVVVKNTNMIADMIDRISPVRPDKCPPVIENSDQILRQICFDKAKEIYGEKLPIQVEERLEKELKSIISNGYAVMYVIAQKLVWKSNEDGYLVGSRGSVGSSFVAFMSGITEVNSLPPHYICPVCHYYDFDSPEVREFSKKGMCGSDMPDRVCPDCGAPLSKEGFDIPFETFLGFKGDKEPDIDLNFSGDYQSKAHKYTEVIFGAGQTFRAGTIGTLAEKTALGYVNSFYEKKVIGEDADTEVEVLVDDSELSELKKNIGHAKEKLYGHFGQSGRRAEKNRLAHGCEGILRTTGQHPGGIVVLPHGEEIYSFTPIQRPANDMKTSIITTHFEYHSIDHNLLKLDILGHDDPTMIRFLQDATGVDLNEIKFDDKVVMELFSSTAPLGITSKDIRDIPTGTLGIPEFGTDFVIGMLVDTQPKNFSDLIRISGLSHGTDVWTGNAQELVNTEGMELSECICCRDDIMLYLIAKGMDPELSFKTMESVRKGKGLKDEMKEAMIAANVPEWYIDSCLKIKYMFPKAHAAAYVMMAWRVAWFKINKPLAYYSGFFSIRAGIIDYATMCTGLATLEDTLQQLLDKYKKVGKKKMTASELDQIRDMRLIEEMYKRGYEFAPIDLKTVDAKYFRQIDDKRIMPSLKTIEGVGGSQADNLVNAIVEASKDGDFLSVDDFRARTGCSANLAQKFKDLGLLGDIPDTNQMSIFDFLN